MATFRMYPGAVQRVLSTSAMEAAMKRRAELVRIRAEQIAPVRSGRYAFGVNKPPGVTDRGFEVTSGVEHGRAYGRVVNRTPYAVFLEFGTRYMKAQRPLGNALDMAL